MSSKSKTMLKETKKALTKKLFSSQDETHKEAKRDLKERANKEKIENVFSTINNKKFSHLETNKDFLEKFKEIENFLSKEEYEDMAQLERVYSLFNPSLYLAWERMYLFKFLNEIDISDSSSIATCLFLELTNALLSGTDGSESCRRDTFIFKNGKIIEYIMDDLRNKNFKEQGNTNIENLILVELSILCNLLTSEFLVPQLIPNLEKEGIDEVIQQYIKNKNELICYMSMNLMGYLKNVDKLASIRADESLAFSVSLLERMMGSKNESNGIMLHELLRTICNLSEIPQNRWRLVQNGLLKALSKVVRGKLVKRAHWKPADRKNEFCSLEKALAIKCLYSYVIDSDFSGTVLEDEALLQELLSLAQNLNANTEDEKLLKTQVQSVFIAFDISINDEMREDPTEIIEEIIQTIENITTNVRNTKSKDGAVISAQNEAAQEESSYDNSSSKPVTLPSNARNEKLKDEKVKGEKAKAEIVIFTDNNKETKQEQAADEVSSRKISTAPAPQIPINASEEKPQTGHIFISYCHQNTTRAMQIRDLLKERGLPIWIDAEAIRGNSVEAMVNGLNYARLVIICMSDGYRQSDFCKREAEYTVLKKKTYQPVIMQEGFHMENDWLCFMVGLQNWIDLGSDLLFDANKSQFVDHVQHLFSTSKEINLSPSSAAKSHTEGTNIASEVKKWKTPDVLKWLDKEQLEDAKEMYCTLIHYTK